MDIQENVSLAPLTTFQIGGPARFLFSAHSVEDVISGHTFARSKGVPVFILGGGSNLLVDDSGYEGLVLKIELKGVTVESAKTKGSKLLVAAAGEGWDALVEHACAEGLWGIENLSGIPGTVGGAVVQNIGAYGAALSQTVEWVEVVNDLGQVERFTNKECAFGYRDSIFKRNPAYVVVKAAFALSRTPKPNISYKDLSKLFNDSSIDLVTVRTAVLVIRKDKFPDLAQEGTAGSFFKNPILAPGEVAQLRVQYPDLPVFAMPETSGVKVPLAWLFDVVLKAKGMSVGGARLYEKQPLVIAAKRNTPSSDVQTLALQIKKLVEEKFQIEIEPEVKIL